MTMTTSKPRWRPSTTHDCDLWLANPIKYGCPLTMIEIKGISKIRVSEVKAATFKVIERKATTEVGESESKKGFLTSFSHSKPCMRFSSYTARRRRLSASSRCLSLALSVSGLIVKNPPASAFQRVPGAADPTQQILLLSCQC
ncbi:hypothetical protein K1719_020893 [Acacia pycnantha]|nr:hypothetical protein K1719_020893 [Acacia pycnantha]